MKASELRAKAEGVVKARTPVVPDQLKRSATKAASEGWCYCHFFEYLSAGAIQELREGGFVVDRIDVLDESYYKISW